MTSDFEHIRNIIGHLEKIHDCMKKIAYHEASKGNIDVARNLLISAYKHDLSKLENIHEFKYLREPVNEFFYSALKGHHKTNKHHPESWNDINNMDDVSIAELVSDCVARSNEFGTDIRQYFEFKFKSYPSIYEKIKYYLNILIKEPFNGE